MNTCTQFNVAKMDFKTTALVQLALPRLDELPDDGLLVAVERFAFTANTSLTQCWATR